MSLQACRKGTVLPRKTVRDSHQRDRPAAGVGASPRVRRPPLDNSPVAQNSVPGRHGKQFVLTAQLVGRCRNPVAD